MEAKKAISGRGLCPATPPACCSAAVAAVGQGTWERSSSQSALDVMLSVSNPSKSVDRETSWCLSPSIKRQTTASTSVQCSLSAKLPFFSPFFSSPRITGPPSILLRPALARWIRQGAWLDGWSLAVSLFIQKCPPPLNPDSIGMPQSGPSAYLISAWQAFRSQWLLRSFDGGSPPGSIKMPVALQLTRSQLHEPRSYVGPCNPIVGGLRLSESPCRSAAAAAVPPAAKVPQVPSERATAQRGRLAPSTSACKCKC